MCTSREHLATYLNDHLASSTVAVEILRQMEAEATDLMPHLTRLRTDIETDHNELKTFMNRLGILESRLKKVVNWIVEQLTEVKLEIDDDSGGALRRLERLEAVALGIDGKSTLWAALGAAAALAPELRGPDYEGLAQRAAEQRQRVEVFRLQAARGALTSLQEAPLL
jgi:hypothetical protein